MRPLTCLVHSQAEFLFLLFLVAMPKYTSLLAFSADSATPVGGLLEDDGRCLMTFYRVTTAGGASWASNCSAFGDWVSTGSPATVCTESRLRLDMRVTCSNDGSGGSRVTRLDVSSCGISGTIPDCIGNNMSALTFLSLARNQLTGTIPAVLVSLKCLMELSFYDNRLSGTIPANISSLSSLTSLGFGINQLSGTIPDAMVSLTSLSWLSFESNRLSGTIPVSLASLPSLTLLAFQKNQLEGTIPAFGEGMHSLESFSFYNNRLNGTIPSSIGSLLRLTYLSFGLNQFSGSIPSSLVSLERLTWLSLESNQLSGPIPEGISSLSNLTYLRFDRNQLNGAIPHGIGSLTGLQTFSFESNQLSGTIPDSLGGLQQLTAFSGSENGDLEGSIPASLGNLRSLQSLNLYGCRLTGSIPATLGSLSSLQQLILDRNQLNGSIPAALFSQSLQRLQALSVSENLLDGTIPASISQLRGLSALNLGSNRLVGGIPEGLGSLGSLQLLNVSSNLLNGTLPASLGSLHSLLWLDASNNRLSGTLRDSWPKGMGLLCSPSSLLCPVLLAKLQNSTITAALFAEVTLNGLRVADNCLDLTGNGSDATSATSWWASVSGGAALLAPQGAVARCSGPAGALVPAVTRDASGAELGAVSALRAVAVVVTGGLSGTRALSALSGGIPLLMQRVGGAVGSSSNALYATDPLALSDSPLQLHVGPSGLAGGAHRGAVVGNVAAGAGVLALLWLYAVGRRALCRRAASAPCGGGRGDRGNVLNAAGLPGSWLAVAELPFVQPTLLSAVVLLYGGSDDERAVTAAAGWRPGEVLIGVLGVVWTAGWVAVVAVRLDPRGSVRGSFGAEYVVAGRRRGDGGLRDAAASPGWVLLLRWSRLVQGEGGESPTAWRDVRRRRRRRSPSFTARYGVLFDGSRRHRHWWTTSEAALSMALAVVAVSASRVDGAAAAGSWLAAAALVAWAVVHALATPFRSRSDHVTACVLSALSAAAGVLVAVSDGDVNQAVADGLNLVAVVVSVLGVVVPAVARIAVLRDLLQQRVSDGDGWHNHPELLARLPALLRVAATMRLDGTAFVSWHKQHPPVGTSLELHDAASAVLRLEEIVKLICRDRRQQH